MGQWVDVAHRVRDTFLRFAASRRGAVRGHLPLRSHRSGVDRIRVWRARLDDAFRQAAREEKVALVGLILVLAVLSWP